jgi:tRNA threonylcarbamoyl adenosine modification protein YeaZ
VKTLFVDTSSAQCVLALAEGKCVLVSKTFFHGNQLASLLIPQIQSMLQQTSISLCDLNLIAVGVGPGSYTGTRVGVIVAKSLSFGLCIPIRGFCSLLLYLPDASGVFRCFRWAKSGDAFTVFGEKTEEAIRVQKTAILAQAEVYPESIAKLEERTTVAQEQGVSKNEIPTNFAVEVTSDHPPNLKNLPLIVNHPPQHTFEQQVELLYFSSIEKFPPLR